MKNICRNGIGFICAVLSLKNKKSSFHPVGFLMYKSFLRARPASTLLLLFSLFVINLPLPVNVAAQQAMEKRRFIPKAVKSAAQEESATIPVVAEVVPANPPNCMVGA